MICSKAYVLDVEIFTWDEPLLQRAEFQSLWNKYNECYPPALLKLTWCRLIDLFKCQICCWGRLLQAVCCDLLKDLSCCFAEEDSGQEPTCQWHPKGALSGSYQVNWQAKDVWLSRSGHKILLGEKLPMKRCTFLHENEALALSQRELCEIGEHYWRLCRQMPYNWYEKRATISFDPIPNHDLSITTFPDFTSTHLWK